MLYFKSCSCFESGRERKEKKERFWQKEHESNKACIRQSTHWDTSNICIQVTTSLQADAELKRFWANPKRQHETNWKPNHLEPHHMNNEDNTTQAHNAWLIHLWTINCCSRLTNKTGKVIKIYLVYKYAI
jgi:hypothetical protein